jgi:hypothetical protein
LRVRLIQPVKNVRVAAMMGRHLKGQKKQGAMMALLPLVVEEGRQARKAAVSRVAEPDQLEVKCTPVPEEDGVDSEDSAVMTLRHTGEVTGATPGAAAAVGAAAVAAATGAATMTDGEVAGVEASVAAATVAGGAVREADLGGAAAPDGEKAAAVTEDVDGDTNLVV